jgi:hypothetical protein
MVVVHISRLRSDGKLPSARTPAFTLFNAHPVECSVTETEGSDSEEIENWAATHQPTDNEEEEEVLLEDIDFGTSFIQVVHFLLR